MKVKDLIEKLKKLDPEMCVVTEMRDHGYQTVCITGVYKAELRIAGVYREYYGPENMSDKTAVVEDVLVLS